MCNCAAGYADCDTSAANGCECLDNCCGGTGGNMRYSSCACSGTSCPVCSALSCSTDNCGTAKYCSGVPASCASCGAGLGNCDQVASNGCETNLNTDPNNCTSCGNVCPDTYGACGAPTCAGGTCGNTKYAAGQYAGCTGSTGCNDGRGEAFCRCDGSGGCMDTCGNGVCDAALGESRGNCMYDCNLAPSIGAVSGSPNPVQESQQIQFSAPWTDDGDSVVLHACKTNALSGQSCSGGSWCDSSPATPSTPVSCAYTAQPSEVGKKDFFAFVCDSNAVRPLCSPTSAQGAFSVNHRPTVTDATSNSSSLPGAKSGRTVLFTATFADADTYPAQDKARLHACRTDAFAGACAGGSWCDSPLGPPPSQSCAFKVPQEGDIVNNAFIFIEDEHGLPSSSSRVVTFYIDRPHQIAQFTAQRLYTYQNTIEDVLVRVFNKKAEAVDVTLTLSGPATFQPGSTQGTSMTIPAISADGKTATFNGMAPKTEEVLVASVQSLVPVDDAYVLTMAAQSTAPGIPGSTETEQDVLEIFSVQSPSFPSVGWYGLALLLIASCACFYALSRRD